MVIIRPSALDDLLPTSSVLLGLRAAGPLLSGAACVLAPKKTSEMYFSAEDKDGNQVRVPRRGDPRPPGMFGKSFADCTPHHYNTRHEKSARDASACIRRHQDFAQAPAPKDATCRILRRCISSSGLFLRLSRYPMPVRHGV